MLGLQAETDYGPRGIDERVSMSTGASFTQAVLCCYALGAERLAIRKSWRRTLKGASKGERIGLPGGCYLAPFRQHWAKSWRLVASSSGKEQ